MRARYLAEISKSLLVAENYADIFLKLVTHIAIADLKKMPVFAQIKESACATLSAQYVFDKAAISLAAGHGGRRPRPVVPSSLRAECFAGGKI